jgi:hypothetical protein
MDTLKRTIGKKIERNGPTDGQQRHEQTDNKNPDNLFLASDAAGSQNLGFNLHIYNNIR